MTEENSTRTFVVNEIVSSEERYIEQLRTLVFEYLRPFSYLHKNGKGLISPEKILAVLDDLERILPLNERFMLDLKAHQLRGDLHTCVGRLFQNYAPFLKIYSIYVDKSAEAAELVRANCDRDRAYGAKVKSRLLSFGKKMGPVKGVPASWLNRNSTDVFSLMIAPVQRLPRYKLLLADLLKATPDEHVDRVALEGALLIVEDVCNKVDTSLQRRENERKIIQLHERFHNYRPNKKMAIATKVNTCAGARKLPLNVHREIIREGFLQKRNRSGKYRRIVLVLSNDAIFYGRGIPGHILSISQVLMPLAKISANVVDTKEYFESNTYALKNKAKRPSIGPENENLHNGNHMDSQNNHVETKKMDGACDHPTANRSEGIHESPRLLFELHAPFKSFVLRAASTKDRDEWVRIINIAASRPEAQVFEHALGVINETSYALKLKDRGSMEASKATTTVPYQVSTSVHSMKSPSFEGCESPRKRLRSSVDDFNASQLHCEQKRLLLMDPLHFGNAAAVVNDCLASSQLIKSNKSNSSNPKSVSTMRSYETSCIMAACGAAKPPKCHRRSRLHDQHQVLALTTAPVQKVQPSCGDCKRKFGGLGSNKVKGRRRFCGSCGASFCRKCLRHRWLLPHVNTAKQSFVCRFCYEEFDVLASSFLRRTKSGQIRIELFQLVGRVPRLAKAAQKDTSLMQRIFTRCLLDGGCDMLRKTIEKVMKLPKNAGESTTQNRKS